MAMEARHLPINRMAAEAAVVVVLPMSGRLALEVMAETMAAAVAVEAQASTVEIQAPAVMGPKE